MRRASMIEGFWLPRAVRHSLIAGRQCWEEACFARGRECDIQQSEETAEGVTPNPTKQTNAGELPQEPGEHFGTQARV